MENENKTVIAHHDLKLTRMELITKGTNTRISLSPLACAERVVLTIISQDTDKEVIQDQEKNKEEVLIFIAPVTRRKNSEIQKPMKISIQTAYVFINITQETL